MTKKFWADWQKRIGETKEVWRWIKWVDKYNIHMEFATKQMSNYEYPNRFISFDFSKDKVDITYEVLNRVMDSNGGHNHSEIHKITLHRNDIKTIKFKDE